jgi:hypothetical protein
VAWHGHTRFTADIDFESAWAGAVVGQINGIPVQYICRAELFLNKESTGRPKDLGDADELRKRDARK